MLKIEIQLNIECSLTITIDNPIATIVSNGGLRTTFISSI